MKRIYIRKQEVKLSLFEDMVVVIENCAIYKKND